MECNVAVVLRCAAWTVTKSVNTTFLSWSVCCYLDYNCKQLGQSADWSCVLCGALDIIEYCLPPIWRYKALKYNNYKLNLHTVLCGCETWTLSPRYVSEDCTNDGIGKVKESRNRPGVVQRVPGGLGSQISWHSAREGGDVSLTHRPPLPPGMFLVLIFTRSWVDPRAMVRSEGNMSLKNPVTPPGIDPGTVRIAAHPRPLVTE